ncbi:uncharacterized protein BT62DRAFT_940616 [Guyanagaster necrorhizus]|uniref:N-acetyltransferase domain-containing protein n=1 Tax=Guyanagaster necrorhizus TaxID=856835 RepID=A0A9P7W5Z8_9AGAR|nr:uncharacterized protein BT62DRAFT_940616 [Guyanagaster necrorhizus MCA 3950]KAG7453219.1 hypothetical protein BT62DRAFT_940616 [Guyanagaster necrorhizus MCA 3950]
MTDLHFGIVKGIDVTDAYLTACTELFGAHYGVWSSEAAKQNSLLKPGAHVKLSPSKARAECLSDPAHTTLALCTLNDGTLVGYAFATQWSYGDGLVSWITQLVVHSKHRRRGIATMLLRMLRNGSGSSAFGLVSSHPAACIALSAIGDRHWINNIDLDFIRRTAPRMLSVATVDYLKDAQLRGSLFEERPAAGTVSSVDTKFYVDREEPLAALKAHVASSGSWPLGELLEGHEFLIVVKVLPL